MAILSHVGEVALRCAVTLLCMFSLILLVRDRQLVFQSVGFDTGVVTTLRYSDTAGLIYLVYSNGLVAMYCAVVAFASFFKALGSTKSGAWGVFLLDQALAYTLLSAASAATEVEYLAEKGDAKITWDSICTTFGHFCHVLDISIVLSFVAVILLAIICVLSAKQLFQQYSRVSFVSKKFVHNSCA